jgi:adenylosuccinate lyase
MRIDEFGEPALFTDAVPFQFWLDVEGGAGRAQTELGIIPAAAGHEIVRITWISAPCGRATNAPARR